MRKSLALLLAALLTFGLLPGAALASSAEAMEIKALSINAHMSSFGIAVDEIIITVDDTNSILDLTKADFTLYNVITAGIGGEPKFLKADRVSYTRDSIIIEVSPFLLAESIQAGGLLRCTNENFSVALEQIDNVVCPEVDVFEKKSVTSGDITLPYVIYEPENPEGKPLPVYVFNHGSGQGADVDTYLNEAMNVAHYATPFWQDYLKCIVVAPLRQQGTSEELATMIKGIIDGLIEDGKVDPDRIFMQGGSAGAMFTMSFAKQFPGYLTSMVLQNGTGSYTDEEAKIFAESGTSLLFVNAVGDGLFAPDGIAALYNRLVDLGMVPLKNINYIMHSTEEFESLFIGEGHVTPAANSEYRVDPITGKDGFSHGLYHQGGWVVGQETQIRGWLINQTKSTEPSFVATEVSLDLPENITMTQSVTIAGPFGPIEGVVIAKNDDGTEFFSKFNFFGEDQILKGTVDADGIITVTYDYSGMTAGLITDIFAAINEDAWEAVK